MDDFEALDDSSRRVALALVRRGPLARADLGRVLGLSAPSLTRLTKPMVAGGLLVEDAPAAQRGTGRPAVPLRVDVGRAHVVGTKITADGLYAVVTDLGGTVVDSRFSPGHLASPAQAVEALAALVGRWRDRWHPVRLGVSLGAVVSADQTVSRVAFLGWPDVRLAPLLQEATGLPTVVANDVHAFTVAEHWFGAGRGCTDLAVLTIGAGVGVGIVAGDELVTGHGGLAGRAGHLLLADGRAVREVVESVPVAARAAALLGRPVGPDDLPALAGDPALSGLFADVAGATGQVAGQLGLLVAPERVVVSGEGAVLLQGHEEALRAGAARLCPEVADRLVVDSPGFDQWARGSAALSVRALLSPR